MATGRSALLVLALTASAPAAPAAPTWADWVGDYAGTLTWKGCFTPGAARARISLDASDGAMTIELAGAGGGLRAMSLVEEEGGWSAQQGDVKLRVTRPRANVLSLVAELGSDCRMHAQLVRPATKIAACDRLVSLARIEARCTKLTEPPLESPALLAKQRATWKAKADAGRCALRADKLETALIEAGCAPVADPQEFVPGPQCQALTAAIGKLQRCPAASGPTRALAAQLAQVPLVGGTAAEREIVEAACERSRRQAASVALTDRCP
ncbi:MAG: hypothetical protein H0T42_22665 [Deltaproteobacteria bacterium]|nr:hypothetical protein [Deltaproteobacteria bacterium]